ncbi:peroxiredoxin [Rubrobacter aplysinae]|uniref:peroxiredoxin n=1 Tax=Rubrobacter aplysinae TaxID=909625 RepID=UPI00064BDBD4|nr:peroxiredoxin [Rubrobacter aplysinae]
MVETNDYSALPGDLPIPEDDGACDHLPGGRLPDLALTATDDSAVNPAALAGLTVIYCYPMTGRPGEALPDGWDATPGARGCTPQSCAFRDHHTELRGLGTRVFGLSTQSTPYQREAAERLGLPYPLLSDAELRFTQGLGLPTFEAGGMTLIRRLTLVVRDGLVEKVFYPVFPPDANAGEVAEWLRDNEPA